jgi:broad specificity phosphatase PhoE
MDLKRIILLRHGESRDNIKKLLSGRSDPDLTNVGNKQAKEASRFIKKRFAPVDMIFTSPLKRALSTAQSISKKLNVPIQEEELLIETNFGSWERSGRSDLSKKPGWDAYTKDPFHFNFPGGESPQDVKKRVLAFKEKLFRDNGWSSAVVVSHYTPIAFFILNAIGGGDERRAGFKIDNAALSVIEIAQDYEYIRMLNFVPWERY